MRDFFFKDRDGNKRVSAKNSGVPHKQQQTLSGQTSTGGDRDLDPASCPRAFQSVVQARAQAAALGSRPPFIIALLS